MRKTMLSRLDMHSEDNLQQTEAVAKFTQLTEVY